MRKGTRANQELCLEVGTNEGSRDGREDALERLILDRSERHEVEMPATVHHLKGLACSKELSNRRMQECEQSNLNKRAEMGFRPPPGGPMAAT